MHKFELLKKDFLETLNKDQKNFLEKVCYYSKCLCDFLFRNEYLLFYLIDNLNKPLLGRENLIYEIKKEVPIDTSDNEFILNLTKFKFKHFGRILSKDIFKTESLVNLMEEYSYLADATIEIAFEKSKRESIKKFGKPLTQEGKISKSSVIALGKLGGKELNYYSDIDIMYIYDDEGKTEKGFTNREFYSYMFSKLTGYLNKKNIEGQTWIVDLDLRPNGKSGFLAYSLPALEVYYWTSGRTWERHMLIKARHSAGDKEVSDSFIQMITPFVYRKTITKEEIEEIIEMKKLIEQEAKSIDNSKIDIKKCEGGIREVEFSVQILQLLYGGKNKSLRNQSTYKSIQNLYKEGLISEKEKKHLSEGYIFLRNLEHIIQIENCIQTQTMNLKNAENYAKKLRYSSKEEFLKEFDKYTNNIKSIFNSIQFGETKPLTPIQRYIFTKHYENEAIDHLKNLGFENPEWALERFKEIFFSKDFVLLSEEFKEALFDFVPYLEEELKEFPDKEDFLLNLTNMFVKGKLIRIFVSALLQNEKLVKFMLDIAKTSDYISSLMAKDQQLLDFAFAVEDVPKTKEDFEKELSLINLDDYIEKLNKLKNIIEVVSSLEYLSKLDEKDGFYRLTQLNSTLSNLADFILEKVYQMNEVENFAIFSLGKLGSKEMNIGSDLDLIFVFEDNKSKLKYHYVPSKIIKDITRYTKEGILYQIDLRLRPYGKAGELSPTINFYKHYFEKEARPWEKLAWTKARFIVGDVKTAKAFKQTIDNFLYLDNISKDFINNIFEMRLKLEAVSNERPEEIDIKLGYGGIVDIEFVAQILMLKEKLQDTRVLSILKIVDSKIIDEYVFLREVETRLRMVRGQGISRINKHSKHFYRISSSFKTSPENLWNDIINTRKRVREYFIRFIKKF